MRFQYLLPLLLIAASVSAGEIKPDPLLPDRQYQVRDRDGRTVQTWRRDPVVAGQIRVYDKNGKLIETIRRDVLFKERMVRREVAK